MEDLSSPGSIGSHTPTAPISASKVTYTTAGTPYNPSTSQPLQPPARRGRSLKWPAGLPAAGLSLLPKSVLATLPLKASTRSSSIQQYSPQAQFDGASSPLNEPGHRCINMSTQVPRMGSSTTPSPLASLFSEAEQDTLTDADQSEESDDEGELGMDPLLNMPVKSLHNLASYPNPNQKRAQKALLRGLKPALGLKMTTRSDGPSTPLPRPVGLPDALNNNTDSYSPFNTTLTETPLIGRSHDDAFWNPHDNQLPSTLPGSSKGFNRAVGSNPSRTASTLGSAAVGSGSGMPLPLTAGPPGQRQYRPSTFESTFKALHTNTPSQDATQDDDDDVLVITRQTLRQAGISTSGLAQSLSPFEESIPSARKDALSAPDKANRATEVSRSSTDTIRGGASAECSTNASQYTGKTAWSRLGTPAMTSNCWASPQERSRPRYISGPRIRTAKDVEAHNKKLNRAWYYGADFLMTTSDEIALKMRSPNGKGQFGAIGDGRPLKEPQFPPPITIEEANRIPVTEHVQPLLNVAFVNVKRFIDEEWQKKNDGAEAATK
ncbi:uncharacterized protein FTOL_00419 [Fusarium torulosum]|uniref:Uncharacterized protein n=1 Tax=Fusarium torulosum TaxID=33205 RepID=A0AAE8LXX6_9HYPO|nr:uncharacterized protein FTOL_00419 [Fusarium torulosum]